MQPVIPDPSAVFQPSLAVEIETFCAQRNVRRSTGRAIATWLGSATIEREYQIAASGTVTISDSTTALVIIASDPVTVTVNTVAHNINTLFVYDAGSTGSITIHNAGADAVNVIARYVIPSS